MNVEHREAKAVGPGLEFVLSDRSIDRHGTVIEPGGWDLSAFKKNPIAFFNHNESFPIGVWERIRVDGEKLLGRLKLAEEGTSERIDEIVRLIRQGILKAVSVGFRPLAKPDIIDGVPHYKKQQLLEASVVGVGSNPNALAIARALGISAETQNLVFGEHAGTTRGAGQGGISGGHAEKPLLRKPLKMEPISKRIEDAQSKLDELRDALTAHLSETGDEPDDTALTVREEMTGKIAAAQRNLDSLIEAEKQLASRAVERAKGELAEGAARGAVTVRGERPFAVPADKPKPGERVLRTLVGMVDSYISVKRGRPKGIEQCIAERYGEDGKIDEATRIVAAVYSRGETVHAEDVVNMVRAATAPATTTTSGWASQLVNTENVGFLELLMPASVFPSLRARGLQMAFGRNGVISIPSRVATPTIAGSFVAEGAPIPVRQGAFTSLTFTPKKMAVISTFTREIAEHSTPAIEGLIRNAIQEDTSVALDTVLLDATAASTTRPAGLRNGVSVTTATSGGGFAALVGDLKALAGALVTGSNGNLRAPTWIMNPVQALAISLTQNAGGDFPFSAEINAGRFQGYPVVLSSTVTAGMVILVDAADFVVIEGGAPRFDVSDQATLHLEDTTPLAIGTAGSPATVAAPVRSLWQTDSIGLRMIMDVNWGMRRTGVIAWTQSVTW
jgi:HK97 family phage major capsid protein/HK97 family phage prohead protease